MSKDEKNIFNVSSKNQQGGVTAGQINIGKFQRQLGSHEKKAIKEFLEKNNPSSVSLTSTMNDNESYSYAQEIKTYLDEINFPVKEIAQATWVEPVPPLHVGDPINGNIAITVGSI